MANRTFDQYDLTIQKKVVHAWAFVTVPTGTSPVLMKYNYPVFGTGPNARGYSPAPLATALPSGAGPWPLQYTAGSELIRSVARTATGLWTITMQDNYQRLLHVSGDMSIAGGLFNIIAIGENPTITNLAAAGGSVVGIAMQSSTATLADPTAAATTLLRIQIVFQDATEP
jgi:hypothetical protein